jgi:hypothetical protein
MIDSNEKLFKHLQSLVEVWCDRRCLRALKAILSGYPLHSPMTDSWAELLKAMQDVRAFAREETTADEKLILEECILAVDSMMRTR